MMMMMMMGLGNDDELDDDVVQVQPSCASAAAASATFSLIFCLLRSEKNFQATQTAFFASVCVCVSVFMCVRV